jgi:Holliday junction resolvasome RuvABC endonuclease subunit
MQSEENSKERTVIGIDPGKSGGIAIINGKNASMEKCPKEPIGMASIINSVRTTAYIEDFEIIACIEKVHAFPTDGRSSAFKFGMNYGMWIGILASFKIPVIKVTPQSWMKKYQPLPKVKQERKQRLKEIAQNLFPDNKITLSTSDAVLIAEHCLNIN